MFQEIFGGGKTNNGQPKVTANSDHRLIEPRDATDDGQEGVKKVTSMPGGEYELRNKNGKFDQKAFKVKLNVYRNMQNSFVDALNKLIKSYETVKHLSDSSSDKSHAELEELEFVVKNIIGEHVGVKFATGSDDVPPSAKGPRDFAAEPDDESPPRGLHYFTEGPPRSKSLDCFADESPPLLLPSELDVGDRTTGRPGLDASMRRTFEDVWRYCLTLSVACTRYRRWLRTIAESFEFRDLADVREYAAQRVQLDSGVGCFDDDEDGDNDNGGGDDDDDTTFGNPASVHRYLKTKLMDVMGQIRDDGNAETEANEAVADEVAAKAEADRLAAIAAAEADKLAAAKADKLAAAAKADKVAEEAATKADKAADEAAAVMAAAMTTLKMENRRLRDNERANADRVKSLSAELAIRERMLAGVDDRIALLTKERNDLIGAIERSEVRGEGFRTLQTQLAEEREKNGRLRAVITSKSRDRWTGGGGGGYGYDL